MTAERDLRATTAAPGAPPPRWHAIAPQAALEALAAGEGGLASPEAKRRLALHGPNRLAEPEPPSALRRLLRQFDNLLLYVLMAAAAITAALGHWIDSAVIAAVVLLNAVIGFLQEGKAERALQAIRHLLAPRAVVMRDGRPVETDAAALVPGDVVVVASGDSVPADARLLQSRGLRVDESALTGESVPVDKAIAPVADDASIGDRLSMVHAGTLVVQGQARAVVVATGAATEVGRIGRMLASVEAGTTPLLARMATFGKRLTIVILAAAALMFTFATLVRGMPLAEAFLAAVGLAVSAIPEGLPAILTITLAIGVQRMAGRRAIVRRLPVVETLGSVTVICSDKTGTLTRNEMTVQQAVCDGATVDVEGVGYAPQGALRLAGEAVDDAALRARAAAWAPFVEAAALCNDAVISHADGAWTLAGDPTEGALAAFAAKAGADVAALRARRPRIDAIPFESEHRFMATLHAGEAAGPGTGAAAATGATGAAGGAVAYVKGAPERILEMCSHELGADGVPRPLEAARWHALVDAQAGEGRRVLALAMARLPEGTRSIGHGDVDHGLVLLGLAGLIDPPREEAIRAVAQCRAAGIRVAMITGDHAATATAIATRLGMGEDLAALTGPRIEAMDDEALRAAVRELRVFARASPEHKLRLVRALKAQGEIVAMTGDGVNDAPALKQADVGVAMGMKGTEAAKQAGSVVLADDNFASIAHAVEEGRTVYDNLRKTVTFLLPINGGESLSLLVAVLLGVALPILPAQVLWVNMVSSVALAMVLAFEPTEPDTMHRPPRPVGEPLLSPFLVWRIVLVSGLFLAGIFGMFEWAMAAGLGVDAARTVAVNTLVCMEVFYLFSVRYLKAGSFSWRGVRGTPLVLLAVAAVFVLQLAFTYAPFMQAAFRTAPLAFDVGLRIVAVGVAVLVLLEIEKALLRRWGR
jgi:magnesium-transporting ATPase (P-type)